MTKKPHPSVPPPSPQDITIYETHVGIYKHHLDIFVRGFSVYVAILGVTAGFIFSDGADGETRSYLSLFMCAVSTMGFVAWWLGFRWIGRFGDQVWAVCVAAGAPVLEVAGFRKMVFVGWLGSLILTLGTFFYYLEIR